MNRGRKKKSLVGLSPKRIIQRQFSGNGCYLIVINSSIVSATHHKLLPRDGTRFQMFTKLKMQIFNRETRENPSKNHACKFLSAGTITRLLMLPKYYWKIKKVIVISLRSKVHALLRWCSGKHSPGTRSQESHDLVGVFATAPERCVRWKLRAFVHVSPTNRTIMSRAKITGNRLPEKKTKQKGVSLTLICSIRKFTAPNIQVDK